MQKRDVLCVLVFAMGGLLSLGDGAVLGVPVTLAAAYLLVESRISDHSERLTAAVAALAR